MSWLEWLGYGFGTRTARALFGDPAPHPGGPIRAQTEEEILADEKRYEEDARRLDAEDAARER